jgi:2-polyprenyl-3-methyl-5-hydroxy-6-metoxy-1,4-benzoquinol methylase
MLIDTGKDSYDANASFDERTHRALDGDSRTYTRDALLTGDAAHGCWRIFSQCYGELASRRGYTVLDIGCGFGRISPFLSMFDCADYLGIDRVAERIAYAKRHYGRGSVNFLVADALTFAPERTFDVVWCCTVMQHLVRPQKIQLVETIKRCLAPGGVALLWESRVIQDSNAAAEMYYKDDCPPHMIPWSFNEMKGVFRPLVVEDAWHCLKIARKPK